MAAKRLQSSFEDKESDSARRMTAPHRAHVGDVARTFGQMLGEADRRSAKVKKKRAAKVIELRTRRRKDG